MQLLDTITVYYNNEPRCIELYQGDLLDLKSDPVDCLVVSAFPGDYAPVPGSLVSALSSQGVDLKKLAFDKAADLREGYSCWWSHDLQVPSSPARRILCFEPRREVDAAELMGDVFQCMAATVLNEASVRTLAMPLLASGFQRGSVSVLLSALLEAAVHWMQAGLAIHRLKLVEISPLKAAEIKGAFAVLKQRYENPLAARHPRHDVFISYCQLNLQAVDLAVEDLMKQAPGLRIFKDTHSFKPGVLWCQELFDAIEHARRVVAFLSPQYLASRMCREEWNIAHLRQINLGRPVLFPVLLYSAKLPSHMLSAQYEDCREADQARLSAMNAKLVASL